MPEPKRIGGSDIGKLVGLSPFGGPIDVYRRCVEGFQVEQTRPMRRGQLLEGPVLTMYAEETGARVTTMPYPTNLVHPKRYPFMVASLDGLAIREDSERVLEAKTASFRGIQDWGEGDDEVPAGYWCQCAWYMAATGLPLCDLAVLIAGDTFRVYTLRRDLELEGMLIETAARFWRDHIEPRRPPPPDASEGYGEWLAARYPSANGTLLPASPEATVLAASLARARVEKEDAEERERAARNALIALIGEADGLQGEGWKVTHKPVKGKLKTDWEAVARAAGAPEALIQAHSSVGGGYRRFLPTFATEKP